MHANDAGVIKVHKVILAARSPVFLAMLTADMQEAKTNSVHISDFDMKTIKEFLRFIYCEKIESLSEVAPSLILAADKYQIIKLRDICCDELLSKLSSKNVLSTLLVAHKTSGTEKLFKACAVLMSK